MGWINVIFGTSEFVRRTENPLALVSKINNCKYMNVIHYDVDYIIRALQTLYHQNLKVLIRRSSNAEL